MRKLMRSKLLFIVLTLSVLFSFTLISNINIAFSADKPWCLDSDGDTYGDPNICRINYKPGYVYDNTDCDDSDANINPDTIWYKDGDSDLYSDGSTTGPQCSRPADHYYAAELIATSGDCDDTDAGINPGVMEACGGTEDLNCDGYIGALRVPEDYTTIQGAIDTASSVCTIVVNDGTYTENITFDGNKSLTVQSINGKASTVIDGNSSGSTVVFQEGAGLNSVLYGFTICNGTGKQIPGFTGEPIDPNGYYGGGIHSFNSAPTITNCTIGGVDGDPALEGNSATFGGGIAFVADTPGFSPVVSNCMIGGIIDVNETDINTSSLKGAGIYLHGVSATITAGSNIESNESTTGNGGGFYIVGGDSVIEDCTITNNTAPIGGGFSLSATNMTIQRSNITGNVGSSYSDGGGGIHVSAASPYLTNCIIADNVTNGTGGGIWVAVASRPKVTNCTIVNNESRNGGGGISNGAGYGITVPVVNSIVWGNSNQSGKSQISGLADVTYSDIEGGWGLPEDKNIDDDPLFIGGGDYHLLSIYSPCFDSGTDDTITYPQLPSDDIDGDLRPQATGYDMGADEIDGCFIRVPEDFLTIQGAIADIDTVNGCVIFVNDGTYVENIDFLGKAITVVSVNGPSVTTIDGSNCTTGSNTCSVVTFDSGEGNDSVLDGFTITDGNGTYVDVGWFGGGIYCNNSSSPIIRNSTISGNTSVLYHGGGVYCAGSSSPVMTDCIIYGNSAGSGGGIASVSSSAPTLTDCTISSNTGTGTGGGLYSDGGSFTITGGAIDGNIALNAGGAANLVSTVSVTITNCYIINNSSGGVTGGLALSNSSPVITNCMINNNSAIMTGALTCSNGSLPIITNCTIAGNDPSVTTSTMGGIVSGDTSVATVVNSIVWDNGGVSGIYVDSPSNVAITYSDIQGGWTGTGNINLDPLFDTSHSCGPYHLLYNSNCIDVGTATGAPADDIDDEARPDASGNVDMGADEYYSGTTCP